MSNRSHLRLLILSPPSNPPIGSCFGRDDSVGQDIHSHETYQMLSSGLAVSNKVFKPFIQALTQTSSITGSSRLPSLHIDRQGYTCEVPIWCEDLPALLDGDEKTTSLQKIKVWTDSMLSEEAIDIWIAVGGFIVLLPLALSRAWASVEAEKVYGTLLQYVWAVNHVKEAVENEMGRQTTAVVVLTELTVVDATHETRDRSVNAAQQLEEILVRQGLSGWSVARWETSVDNEPKHVFRQVLCAPSNEFEMHAGIERILKLLEQIDWTGLIYS